MENQQILEVVNLSTTVDQGKSSPFAKTTKRKLLENLSFSIETGETLGLMGPSGIGKSTLARVILGLHSDFSGEVIHHSQRPQMVFQDPHGSLNPRMTVGAMLKEAFLSAEENKGKDHSQGVLEMLHLVDLSQELLNRKPQALSGGQKQRVSIALALLAGAKFIVLDEPVSALDASHKLQILKLLKQLQEQLKLSYLFISHDMQTVQFMCKRVLLLEKDKQWQLKTL